jgi:hypothetical protein
MFLMIYLFLMLYTPRVGALGDFTVFVSVYLIAIAFLKGVVEPMQVRRVRTTVVVLFITLLTYSLLIFLNNRPYDLSFLRRFARALFQFLGCYALLRLYYYKYGENVAEKLLEHMYWAIAAHAVIMMMMFVSTAFREFIFTFVQASVEKFEERGFRAGARITGLVGALDALSVVQSFGVLLFPLIAKQLKGIKAVFGGIALLFILFSIFISARTGIILLVLFMPILLIKTKQDFLKIATRLGLTFVILITLAFIVTPTAEIQERVQGQVRRITRLFETFKMGGEEGEPTGAVGKLLMDFKEDWPKDASIFIFGNSSSCRTPWYFIPADPGWILDVHGIGLIGSAMVLWFYIICLREGFKCLPYNKYVGLICILYTLEAFIANAKGRYFMTRVGLTISCVLLFLSVYCRSFGLEYEDQYQQDLLEFSDDGEEVNLGQPVYS